MYAVQVRDDLNERRAIAVIKILLENGADINMKSDCDERTALHIACGQSTWNVIKLLLSHGADPNYRDSIGITPLLIASMCLSLEDSYVLQKMKVLLDLRTYWQDVTRNKSYYGHGVFHDMKSYGSKSNIGMIRCVQLLIEYGADVNAPTKGGFSPLLLLVKTLEWHPNHGEEEYNEEYIECIRLLLDSNVNVNNQLPNATDTEWSHIGGDTPLHIVVRAGAVRTGMFQSVKLLMEYRPNLFIYNHEYKTVLDIAKEEKCIYQKLKSIEVEIQFDQIITYIEIEQRNQIYEYISNDWIHMQYNNNNNKFMLTKKAKMEKHFFQKYLKIVSMKTSCVEC